MTISFEEKKSIRLYFNIKNITQARNKAKFNDTDLYYEHLKTLLQPEPLSKSQKKRLKKKKSLEKKKFALSLEENVLEEADSLGEENSEEQIKRPYLIFKNIIPYLERSTIIKMMNLLWNNSVDYFDFIKKNNYNIIKITKGIHLDINRNLNSYHFNGFFKNKTIDSNIFHFYIFDNKVVSMTELISYNFDK